MELYDIQRHFYKDNVEDQCWDAVGAAVGITRFLNITYAMFMYHVSEKESSELKGLVTIAEKFASGGDSFFSVVADRSRSWRCAARPGASQPVCPRRLDIRCVRHELASCSAAAGCRRLT